jgi:protein-tyrosine-phosphatase
LRGYHLDHAGRQIHPDDFIRFDLIIAMDRDNASDLERLRGGEELRLGFYRSVEPVQVQLLRRWDPFAMPGDEDLPDPWGRPPQAYADMFDVIERTIPPLIDHLEWLISGSG